MHGCQILELKIIQKVSEYSEWISNKCVQSGVVLFPISP